MNKLFCKKFLFTCFAIANVLFAFAQSNTNDVSNYQYIDPNIVNDLDPIEFETNTIKFMLEFVGTSESNSLR